MEVELGVWWNQKLALFFDDSKKFFKKPHPSMKKCPVMSVVLQVLVAVTGSGSTVIGLL